MTKPTTRGTWRRIAGAFTATALAGCLAATPGAAARLPAPAFDPPAASAPGVAVLSGGCFWGVQGVFEHVRGVKKVWAGYAGGARDTASYESVSTGTTGHAETVQILFDPKEVSYGQILRIFFSVATDPTQVNRQGPDEGPQYRSEIFYQNPAQASAARRYVAQLTAAHAFHAPIATRVDRDTGFYRAEGYHQDYLERHPTAPYIVFNDLPKLRALRADFASSWRSDPVL
jgi:peptide-methionine (S)-S-oxide reductase